MHFLLMKMYEFRLTFHWNLFLMVKWTVPALVQITAWRRPGDKPLSEPMTFDLLTHICVTWPLWVKYEHGLVLLCFVVVTSSAPNGFIWFIYPYLSGLHHRHRGNLMIAPVTVMLPWKIQVKLAWKQTKPKDYQALVVYRILTMFYIDI